MDRMRQLRLNKIPALTVFICFLYIVFGLSSNTLADSERHVVIITSSDSSYQQQTATRIQKNIDNDDTSVMIISADDVSPSLLNSKTLFVAIGENAIRVLDEFDRNAIVLRLNNKKIPDTSYTSAQSDLITEQPACKHLQLIRALDPEWTTIGVLSSINSVDTSAELTICAIEYNLDLQLYAITSESDLLKTLENAVENNQVLLAIADPLIYNSRTVKNILLTSYRHRKPVIGYSDSFVQAGAVAAIYTSPESAGDNAARIISEFFNNNWQFKKKSYNPRNFSVNTNKQVAKSLEITLPDIVTIMNSIKKMDIKP